jgi:hypothetical protein
MLVYVLGGDARRRNKRPVSDRYLLRTSASPGRIRRTGRLARLKLGGRHRLVRLAGGIASRSVSTVRPGAGVGRGEHQADSSCREDKPHDVVVDG